MSKKNVMVAKNSTGWRVQVGKTTLSNHQTQGNAINKGKSVAKRLETELIVQGRDGKIRSKDSYGKDPNPPHDKEH